MIEHGLTNSLPMAERDEEEKAFDKRVQVGIATVIGALFFVGYCSQVDGNGNFSYGDLYFGIPFRWGYNMSDAGFGQLRLANFGIDLLTGAAVGGLLGAGCFLFGGKRLPLKWISITAAAGGLIAFFATRPAYPAGLGRVNREANAIFYCLRQYDQAFGERPGKDVMAALTGDNRDGIVFLSLRNGDRDPWGNPYDVSLSDQLVWVRSAGPDGVYSEAPLAGKSSDDIVRFSVLPPGWHPWPPPRRENSKTGRR